MLGRDMADDGRAARETVTTARDTEVADTGRAGPRRDPATDPTARDPAPAPFARDRRYGTRSGTGSFRPRPTLWHAIRHRLFSHATDFMARDPAPDTTARDDPFLSDDVWLSGYVRFCPDMSGYVRTLRDRVSQRCDRRACSACAMT